MECVKCITFLSNLLFAITGGVIFFVGLVVQLKYNHYTNFVAEHVWTVPIILMVVGLVVTGTCILGCCGAIKEKSWMIMGFAFLAIVIFICEVVLGVVACVKHSHLKGLMEEQFNMTMNEYADRQDYQDAWSLVQTELSCCGAYGPKDWEQILNNTTLPSSCCAVIQLDEASECTIKHAHPDGCFKKLLTLIDSNTVLLAGVALAVAGIQILIIILACCLYRKFRRNYETV